jgi:hypothetical protein
MAELYRARWAAPRAEPGFVHVDGLEQLGLGLAGQGLGRLLEADVERALGGRLEVDPGQDREGGEVDHQAGGGDADQQAVLEATPEVIPEAGRPRGAPSGEAQLADALLGEGRCAGGELRAGALDQLAQGLGLGRSIGSSESTWTAAQAVLEHGFLVGAERLVVVAVGVFHRDQAWGEPGAR